MPSAASSAKTRNALVLAAQAFLAVGRDDFSVPEVTRAAGVSVGSLYTHFTDKTHLIEQAAIAALDEAIPELQRIVMSQEDRALGFLASMAYSCSFPETNPRLARIIVTAGVSGFASDRSYAAGPIESLADSAAKGLAKCDDPEAFALMVSAAYMNVLAIQMSDNPVPRLAERTIRQLGRMLGYGDSQLDAIVSVSTEVK